MLAASCEFSYPFLIPGQLLGSTNYGKVLFLSSRSSCEFIQGYLCEDYACESERSNKKSTFADTPVSQCTLGSGHYCLNLEFYFIARTLKLLYFMSLVITTRRLATRKYGEKCFLQGCCPLLDTYRHGCLVEQLVVSGF